jgi:membrane-bound metal-dependent hydrolase YbcI (DUF457 family)
MTPVGHVLTGISIGVVSMPERKKTPWKILYFVAFSLLSLVPDFHIPYWGHDRYYISHSIFTNLLAILILILLLSRSKKLIEKLGGWKVIIGGSLAWLSHLLLDTFYNHGKGLLMFWPFSEARLALPIPWFSVVKDLPPPFTEETIRILLIELVSYGALLLVVIVLKRSGALQWMAQHIFRTNNNNASG